MYAVYHGELDKLIEHLREKHTAEQWRHLESFIRDNHYLFSEAIIGHGESEEVSLELLGTALKYI